ncbi:MAG: acetoacetate decarboxylase family protein, partial [Nevskiales bacterium]
MAQTSAVSRSSPTADFPIIKAGLGEFQPGVIARRRSDLKPTVSDLLSGETTGRDDLIDPQYFDQLRGHEVFDYSWDGWEHPVSLFPMIYSDVSMVAAAYTLPIGQAQTLLPATARLTPMRLTPWRAVILFFAFDYRRGGLGTYREFGAAIPVLLDAPRALPLIPALRDAWRPNSDPRLGMFAVELPVDQERACVAGIKLYGLPKLVGRSEFEMDGAGGRVSMD